MIDSREQQIIDFIKQRGACSSKEVHCHYMKRKLIGYEIDKKYYDAACKRFKEQTMQQALTDPNWTDGQTDCYLTSFTIDGKEYHIVSDLNEKSDKLTFYKRPS